MKYLFGIILATLIIPAFLPSQFTVERQKTIQHSAGDTYSYLVNLESWAEWSPWFEQEPNAKRQFDGIPGVVGSSVSWDGEVIGAGKQTLTKLEEPNYLETQLEFTKPQQSKGIGYMRLKETPQGVQVTWGLKGDLSYPVERVFGLFMDSMVGKDFERGLTLLKAKLEKPEMSQ